MTPQVPNITGAWVDHPSAEHIGLYDPRTDCPEYAEDFNCLRPYPPAQPDPELAAREFRKARRPTALRRQHAATCNRAFIKGFLGWWIGRLLGFISDLRVLSGLKSS